MRIVVTGAAGNIGRHVLADLAEHGHEAVAVDRAQPPEDARPSPPPGARVTWHIGDARDQALMERACIGADALIHLAAIPTPRLGTPLEVFGTNVTATFVALEAAGDAGVGRVVVASSVSLLGIPYAPTPISPLYAPIDEEHPNIGSDPYALSKEVDEATLRTMHRRHGYQAVALRITATAPIAFHEERRPRVEADPGMLAHELWGYLDSRDAARAFALSVERDIPGTTVINVQAGDINVSSHTTAELMARYHPATALRRPLVGGEVPFDLSRMRDLLGLQPRHRLFPERDDAP